MQGSCRGRSGRALVVSPSTIFRSLNGLDQLLTIKPACVHLLWAAVMQCSAVPIAEDPYHQLCGAAGEPPVALIQQHRLHCADAGDCAVPGLADLRI